MEADLINEAPSLEERIATAEALAYGQQSYLTEEGEFDTLAIIDVITDLVTQAVATSTKERAKVGVSRRAIMDKVFPKVPGPEAWADEDDPELAEKLYDKLDQTCWRMTSTTPSGPIQSRLNGDHGLVLCRTKVNPHKTDAVYTTRDLKCLLEDALKPVSAAAKKRADRDAAFTVMLIERVPEHSKKFDNDFVSGMKSALDGAKTITAHAVRSITVEADDNGDDE